jgi:hypothetical protein
VGALNRRTRDKLIAYVTRNAPTLSLLTIHPDSNCQGFRIVRHGEPDRRDVTLGGLWLVAEKWQDPLPPTEENPF